MKKKLELYIHIPFCKSKCKYCDFLSSPNGEEFHKEYVEHLIEEIKVQSTFYTDYQVSSIFIGGGTPSIISGVLISNIMSTIYENFVVEGLAEITIETNPESITSEKLSYYKEFGINRISIGLQSTSDEELKLLGRVHTYEKFLESYQKVKEAGFENINIDIMNAIPSQDFDSWKQTLKNIVLLRPTHISAYSLIVEEGTEFYNLYEGEKKPYVIDEDLDRKMYSYTKDYLKKHGYERYEISNYSKKGYECKHNIGYWTGIEYLGLGLGASSYAMNRRFHVERDMQKYMEIDFDTDITPLYQDVEELTKENLMEEFMFLGLRLTKGVSAKEFMDKFNLNMFNVFEKAIKKNMLLQLLEYKTPILKLTYRGIDVSNKVMSDFLF